jgi:hypothetical protein
MRSDLPARPSSSVATDASLFALLPVSPSAKAEMKYIADYPADAGSSTRLHGSSGARGYFDRYLAKNAQVRDGTRINDFSSLTALRGRNKPLDHTCPAYGRRNSITSSFTSSGSLPAFCRHTPAIGHIDASFLLAPSYIFSK